MICDHTDREQAMKLDPTILWKCRTCGLIFNEKFRENIDLKKLYSSYYFKNEAVGRFGRWIECVVRAFRFFRAFKMFTIKPDARTILDIGSGRGFMLHYLKNFYGYTRTAGTQISRSAFEFSRDRLRLEMYDRDLLELRFENNAFDIVTLWHVLEHVMEPEKYVECIRDLLKPDGRLVIEVPNFNSWTRVLTGKYWLGLDPEHHIYFFTPDSLSNLLSKYGFKTRIVHTFSLEYSTFISVQSIVSRLTKTDHIVFRSLQLKRFNWKLLPHFLLFAILTPFCFIINLATYFSKNGEILLVVAQERTPQCSV
jgi:SAM-dependent methyltransferase